VERKESQNMTGSATVILEMIAKSEIPNEAETAQIAARFFLTPLSANRLADGSTGSEVLTLRPAVISGGVRDG
jgi:hypothetical protein